MKKPATAIDQKPPSAVDALRSCELKLASLRERVAVWVAKENQTLREPSEVERRRVRHECAAEIEAIDIEIADEEARRTDLYKAVLHAIEAADDAAIATLETIAAEKCAADDAVAARREETIRERNAACAELDAARQRAAEFKRQRIAAETPPTPEQRREAEYSARLQSLAAAQPAQLEDTTVVPTLDKPEPPSSADLIQRRAAAEMIAQNWGGAHV
jgi:hypothetical protein